ncbi:DUF6702 family protein [Flavobacterium sp. RSB2_4_14]|uniref:DUF6702 family protein n=1 Tax=Flavobacterium sp. RSB2_4_14 TaxID=3447665 RepID=UPI003F418F6E
MRKISTIALFIVLFIVTTAMIDHRFYTAIYQINFVPQKKMVQITTRIFADDLNDALKNQYHKTTFLGTEKETPEDVVLMKKYLSEKFKFSINGKFQAMNFLSKELEDNVIICYYTIKDIPKINSLEVENSILTEIHPEQQNIIQFNDNGTKKSLLLSSETYKGMLK